MKRCSLPVVLLSAGFALALVGCTVFAYRWIDTSITLSYLDSSYHSTLRDARLAQALLEREWSGMTKQELLEKLKAEATRRGDRAFIKTDENGIVWFSDVGDIGFEFEAGKLQKVR